MAPEPAASAAAPGGSYGTVLTATPPYADAHPHVNLSAVFGALACALVVVAFFLSWIDVPASQREPIRRAYSPRIEELADTDPALAQPWRMLLAEAADTGHLSGLDLFLYARSARELNRAQSGAASDEGGGRTAMLRRAFLVGYVILAVLPVLGLLLSVHFLVHRFRRARSPVLILMILLGCAGGAIAIAWDQAGLGYQQTTGIGLRLMLCAAVAQVSAGLFGVTSKNWWRVYTGALATLAALSAIVWIYVASGAVWESSR